MRTLKHVDACALTNSKRVSTSDIVKNNSHSACNISKKFPGISWGFRASFCSFPNDVFQDTR